MTPPRTPAPEAPTNAEERPQDAPVATPPSAAAPSSSDAEKRTPAEWADHLGLIRHRDKRLPQSETVPHWKHAAADTLYGWSLHAYHFQGERFELTQEQYERALESAAAHPAAPLVPEAITPTAAKKLEGFKPARNLKDEKAEEAKKAAAAKKDS